MDRSHSFRIKQNLYKDKFENGEMIKSIIFKRNVITRIDLDLDTIYAVEEVIGQEGKTLKGKCKLYTIHGTTFTVDENKEQITNLVFKKGEYGKGIGFGK